MHWSCQHGLYPSFPLLTVFQRTVADDKQIPKGCELAGNLLLWAAVWGRPQSVESIAHSPYLRPADPGVLAYSSTVLSLLPDIRKPCSVQRLIFHIHISHFPGHDAGEAADPWQGGSTTEGEETRPVPDLKRFSQQRRKPDDALKYRASPKLSSFYRANDYTRA